MNSYRLKAENASTLLRLKEASEKDQQEILKSHDLINKQKEIIKSIELERDIEIKKNINLNNTINILQNELKSTRNELNAQIDKKKSLEIENNSLINRLLTIKSNQVDQMNAINDMYTSIQKKKQIEEYRQDRVINNSSSSKMMKHHYASDTSSILNVQAWSSNFNVIVPNQIIKEKKISELNINYITYNKNGKLLATCDATSTINIIDTTNYNIINTLKSSNGSLMSISFSSDDTMILATSNNSSAYLWYNNNSNIKLIKKFTGHSKKIYASSFNLDNSKIITGSHDRTIRLWDINSNAYDKWSCSSSCNSLSLSPNGNIISTAHLDNSVRFYSLRTKESMKILNEIHSQQVTSVEFSKDGTEIITNSRDNTLKLIDIRTWKVLKVFTTSILNNQTYEYINGVNWNKACFSPDCQYVTAGSIDGSIFIWNINTAELYNVLSKKKLNNTRIRTDSNKSRRDIPKYAITSIDWNTNGKQIVSSNNSGKITFYGSE